MTAKVGHAHGTKIERELAQVLIAEVRGGEPRDVVLTGDNRAAITDAKRLVALGKQAHKWAELLCNGIPRPVRGRTENQWTDEDQANYDKAEANILAETMEIAQRYEALNVRVMGDPRGYCLRLMLKSRRHNTWGGAEGGWGI